MLCSQENRLDIHSPVLFFDDLLLNRFEQSDTRAVDEMVYLAEDFTDLHHRTHDAVFLRYIGRKKLTKQTFRLKDLLRALCFNRSNCCFFGSRKIKLGFIKGG